MTIELYGVPRLRAGRSEVTVPATTVGEALRALAVACPGVSCLEGARIGPHLVCVDGREFVTDARRVLRAGERLLVLSADVGG